MPGENVETKLSRGRVWTTASCRYKGKTGLSKCRTIELDDKKAQYILKTAIYRAALSAGKEKSPWGTVTGVRPGKLMRQIMDIQEFSRLYATDEERAGLVYETSLYTNSVAGTLRDNDICLYVGIPFCPTRCEYCSFVSQSVEKSMNLVEPFFEALLRETRAAAECCSGKKVISIYFGGGTPTTLNEKQLDDICKEIENGFDLSELREFCVEAGRPDTITDGKLRVLKKHGVGRISVNPQTMDDRVLERIGRHHSSQDVLDAINLAAGLDVNMDLIAGLPTDTLDGFKKTIDGVLEISPANITVHTLSLKKGSRLIQNPEDLPDCVGEMLEYAYSRLREQNYNPYYLYRQKNMQGGFENTGWTKPGHENIYNICMMEELCTIVALGAGGSSKLVNKDGANLRIVTPKYPLEYIQNIERICEDKKKICTI